MASRIRWKGNAGPSEYRQRIHELGSAVPERMEENLRHYMNYGKNMVQQRIRAEDRVRSGSMLGGVTSSVTRRGNRIVGKFGWSSGQPPWSLFQERGTYESRTDKYGRPNVRTPGRPGIEPMHALLDAYVMTRDRMKSKGLL